jgi:spore germination protein (amino acid permease)
LSKNPEREIINTKQYIWILFVIITSFTALQIPGLLLFQAGRDAWLSVLAAWFLDVMLAVVYAYMGIRFPGENPIQYSISILGKVFGRLAGLLFITFSLIVCAGLMRGLAMYVGNVFLPNTPDKVVLLGAFIVIAYIARKGIEVIARICEILGPLYLISLIILPLLTFPDFHFEWLKPQLEQGGYPFLSGTPLILSYIGICIAMGWYSPICNRPENGFLAKFSSVSMGTFSILMVIFSCICCFGAEQAGNMINPGLQLVRLIRVSDYFERMEVIWTVVAVGAGIITAANAVWIFSLGVAQIAGVKSYKPLVYPSALLCYVLTLTSFPNNIAYMNFAFYIFPLVGVLIESGLEIFLWIVAMITGKKGKSAPSVP